ncbi:MAG: ABC transporter permease, partial [Chitinophagaceae bacterium]
MASTDNSLWTSAWKKLKKNKAAVFGIIVIIISVLVSIFSYFIAPDDSPDSNRMIIEIGGMKPGTRQLFLTEEKDSARVNTGFFRRLVGGRKDRLIYIPVNSYLEKGDSVIVMKYIDEGVQDRLAFPRSLFGSRLADHFVRKTSWLGTDKYGRDILSRLIVGTRVSLAVGLISLIISVTIGILLGAMAGYFRGWVDDLIMWLINVIWSIPTLLLVFA